MKKVLLALMTLMILTMQPLINANATTDDVNDTTQIEEEKTPEAGRQKKTNQDIALFAFFTVIVVAGYAVWSSKDRNKHLMLTDVSDNGDGSYTIIIEYDELKNPIKQETEVEENIDLKVKQGNAIVLEGSGNNETIEKRKKKLIAVINSESIIEVYAGKEKVVIDGHDVIKGRYKV